MKLFLAMIIVTAIEIMLIGKVSSIIGGWGTFFTVIITAMIGSWQLKKQGRATLNKLQTLQTEPTEALSEGMILLICGVLLITPGFLTDIVGFLGLVPKIRQSLAKVVKRNFNFASKTILNGKTQQQQNQSSEDIIEGEFTVEDENKQEK